MINPQSIERLREADFTSERIIDVLQKLDTIAEMSNATNLSVTLDYEPGESQLGELIPYISIGFRPAVVREQ